MHNEILSTNQVELLPLLKNFSEDFGLVGGTAIALQIGHRRSIDFDLITRKKIDHAKIRRKIKQLFKIEAVLIDTPDEFTLIVQGVKITFLYYDFPVVFKKTFQSIKMPDLLDLSAMKAYTLGRRAKWKDYIDLYFILKQFHSIDKVIGRAKHIFKGEFNEKNFRSQLAYFKDLDYSEKIDYLKGFEKEDEIVKKELIKISLLKIN